MYLFFTVHTFGEPPLVVDYTTVFTFGVVHHIIKPRSINVYLS